MFGFGDGGHTYLWDAATGRRTAILSNPWIAGESYLSVAFSRDGRTLAAASTDGAAFLCPCADGTTAPRPGHRLACAVYPEPGPAR